MEKAEWIVLDEKRRKNETFMDSPRTDCGLSVRRLSKIGDVSQSLVSKTREGGALQEEEKIESMWRSSTSLCAWTKTETHENEILYNALSTHMRSRSSN